MIYRNCWNCWGFELKIWELRSFSCSSIFIYLFILFLTDFCCHKISIYIDYKLAFFRLQLG